MSRTAWKLGSYVFLGMFSGLLIGIYEAALLRPIHDQSGLNIPQVGPMIWALAPLGDVALFAALGLVMGLLDVAISRAWPAGERLCLALHLGLILTYAITASFLLAEKTNSPWLPQRLRNEFLCLAVVFGTMLLVVSHWNLRLSSFLGTSKPPWRTPMVRGMVGATGILLAVVLFYPTFRFKDSLSVHAAMHPSPQPPNIVLITLDTVRADHLSAYGYSRPTSSNLDRLGARGVLFENAISASSFTSPSHASIFRGVLPHQHGATWFPTAQGDFKTLAEILSANGYETAGFTANYFYGIDGWGMERGFEFYDDDTTEIRHNLAATLVGSTVLQPLYERFVEDDRFDRRDAPEVNRAALRWLRYHSGRPFFMFLNYFDAHLPYLPPAPYNHRFGQVSTKLNRLLRISVPEHLPPDTTEAERESLIAGYDNSISYLDVHVARFLEALDKLPGGSNTYVIITSDHGDSFGEHETYGHGLNLYRELIHVPLIIYGPGIPAGGRVPNVVPTRRLFGTILDLTLPGRLIPSRQGLRGYWDSTREKPQPETAVSELVVIFPTTVSIISMVTPEWHFLRNSRGQEELYRWHDDPLEKNDLSNSPQGQAARAELRNLLYERIRSSPRPWRGRGYLAALNQPGHSFVVETARGTPPPRSSEHLITDLLSNPKPIPPREERDLIQSIPY